MAHVSWLTAYRLWRAGSSPGNVASLEASNIPCLVSAPRVKCPTVHRQDLEGSGLSLLRISQPFSTATRKSSPGVGAGAGITKDLSSILCIHSCGLRQHFPWSSRLGGQQRVLVKLPGLTPDFPN